MDLATKQSVPPHNLHSSGTSFPIIAIAIIGILATAFLLVSYYIFVIKCCLNWHRIDLLRRFSLSRDTNHDDPLIGYFPPAVETRGLDESVIRSIPIFKFNKVNRDFGERSFCECAVCLNEFQEDEKLRIIPNCSHVFHIDCIDIWLQNNANCPLCRNSISSSKLVPTFDHRIINMAPSSSPEEDPINPPPPHDHRDYVVIELSNSADSGEFVSSSVGFNPKIEVKKKSRKLKSSMGDECIDIREKDEQFAAIQPIRRSFSMDSSADRQLYLSIQEIVQQNNRQVITEGSRRHFFSFKGSRSSILPLHLEPE